MKVLFIGGTGNISTSVSKLAVEQGIDLFLLNRGKSPARISGAAVILGDIYDPNIASVLHEHRWDAVVNWIAFTEQDIRRDFELFNGKTAQYVFISSASAYQKPVSHYLITESTPLANPYWQYSRNKIACEELLMSLYRQNSFPATVVRPSHTYDTIIPVPVGGGREYTTVDRIKKGKKIIVHGDGSSLWTLTHAEDFAKAFVGLLGHQLSIGHAFHITSDESLSWDQIHYAIASHFRCTPQIVHIASELLMQFEPRLEGELIGDKSASVIFDNTKIKTFVPGYFATIPFRRGIARTLDWFEADPSRQVIKQETNDWIDHVIARYDQIIGH